MPVILDRVPVDCVERIWPHVEPHIRAGCDATTTILTPESVKADVLSDRLALWVVIDTEATAFPVLAAAAAGFNETNRGCVFFVKVMGGRDGKRWLRQCLADLEQYAKEAGAITIEIIGRRGWRRALRGYREAGVIMEKAL